MTHKVISRATIETTHPDVFITFKKSRLRIYQGKEIFLNSGDEFELEFDNTTRITWLSKIKLNDEWVSEAGLVLRPGEHIFLDTPNLGSGDKRRFKFETYEIDKGRSHLVKKNGLVEIFFHKKQQPQPVWIDIIGPPLCRRRWDDRNSWKSWKSWNPYPWTICSSISGYTNKTDSSESSARVGYYELSEKKDKEETGRVEPGSESNQIFIDTNENFSSSYSHVVRYKILPVSKKPKTIQEVKEYCSNCGRRHRKSERFCSNCGTKYGD